MIARADVAAMVTRIDAARSGTAADYTPNLRRFQALFDAACRARDDKQAEGLIGTIERTWYVEISRCRRLAAKGATP